MTTPWEPAGRFVIARDDMELFAAASSDVNPLHVSSEYARHTAFGELVVFGVLGALAAFSSLDDRAEAEVESLSLEFRGPLFIGVEYRVEWREEADERVAVRVRDIDKIALQAAVVFRSATPPNLRLTAGGQMRPSPAVLDLTDITPGLTVSGSYAPQLGALARIENRWALAAKGLPESTVIALLWSSYLVGMEVPGERATFWRLQLDLEPSDEVLTLPLFFEATVKRRDERVALVELDVSLTSGGAVYGSGSVAAFVRTDPPHSDIGMLARSLEGARGLDGKTALVVGGSRGLGAAIVQALAMQRAHVILVYRDSRAEAERVRESVVVRHGAIELIQGDAGDARWCQDQLLPLIESRGGLDVLVCNASPPIRPLSFISESSDRFDAFVGESLRLVSAPLSALLDNVATGSGTVVVISSTALRTLPSEWPHYVTAKAALEGLVGWAAARYPAVRFIVVRPPKLLTDQMNTLLGRSGAANVEPVAAAILNAVGNRRPGTAVELLEPKLDPSETS